MTMKRYPLQDALERDETERGPGAEAREEKNREEERRLFDVTGGKRKREREHLSSR